jgi:hypothetical protein
LTRHLRSQAVPVIEVTRPNRQTRRQHGKTDVIDAIAAGRAVLSGQATAIAKTRDGQVEALRTLKLLLRGISKNRTQAINQLKSLLVFAPDPLRERLRGLPDRELLDTCANFRIAGTTTPCSAPPATRCASWPSASRTSPPGTPRPRSACTASPKPSPRTCWPSKASGPTPPAPC